MLILTEYKICQKAQAIGSFFFFFGRGTPEKCDF